MREADFRAWLNTQAYKPTTVNTWIGDARRVEKGEGDLDAAYDADRCEALLSKLTYSARDREEGRENPSAVDIPADKLYFNLASFRSAVRSYCRFRTADLAGGNRGLTREAVFAEIEKFKAAGSLAAYLSGFENLGTPQTYWLLIDGERYPSKAIVHGALGFSRREQGYGGTECRRMLASLGFLVLNSDVYEELCATFLRRMAPFTSFQEARGPYWDIERQYKNEIIEAVRGIAASSVSDAEAGRAILRKLAFGKQGLPVNYMAADTLAKAPEDIREPAFTALGELARTDAPDDEAMLEAAKALERVRAAGLKHFAIGNVLSIVASVRGSINPEAATWFKIEKLREAGRKLFDRELFTNPQVRPDDIAAYGQMMRAVFDLLDHDRGWEPVDLFDVQGFLWVALCTPAEWKEDDVSDTKTDAPQSSETANETDQDVLAHFDRSWPGFQRTRDSWFPAQVSAFCAMARAINEAGLDQYESVSYRGSGTPFQLGIKRRGTQRAEKYLGNFTFRASGNYLWLHDSKLTFSLDESSVERFRTDLARLIEDGQIEPVTDRNAYWPDDYNMNDTASCAESSPYTVGSPTNLILYGPPGTGKTYTTAYEAVRLCLSDTDFPDNADGRQTWLATPDRRAELMRLYRELVDDGRIGFVTFHQSYAYEDFVEGLRPPVDTDAVADNLASSSPEAPISSGLKLSVHDGLFKRIADRARLDTGESSAGAGDRLDRTRSVFKIALGRRNSEEAQILQALNEGIIHLGWGGNIDWSDERFDSFNAILDEWQRNEPDATGKNANVEQIYALRSLMQPGDYVVVSDGRDLIRAVGQVTSGYQFKLDATGYPHRRQVNWLWREDTGIPRDTIYPNWFRQHSLYELNEKVLNWDALDKLVCGTERAPAVDARPYVLVIDEINRGNISKIFGELITLIEPDKRLHPNNANALEVLLPYSQRRWGVPANLHIIGTMNTADRSIALLDTALRRRFTFREMAPRHELLEPVAGIDLAGVLKTINERVEYLLDREHRIGHAFFMGCKDKTDVDGVMRDKVIPLLQEYFFEDFARVNAILGDGFIVGVELKAPPGFEAHGKAPKSWSVRMEFDVSAYHALSGKAFEGVANAANANI